MEFKVGDLVKDIRFPQYCGIVVGITRPGATRIDYPLVKWDDRPAAESFPASFLALVRRPQHIGYFAMAEALEGDHPYNAPICSPDAEYAFYCLLAHGKVQPSGA